MFQAFATVELGTGDGVGLPGFAGRAGKASTVLGVEKVGFGGVGGGLTAEAAVVETDGSGGTASLPVEGFVGAIVGVPGLTVLVGAAEGLAVEVGTVTPDFAVVLAVVGATVVVLSFLLPPNNPPKKPPPDFFVVGTGVVVVGLGVVVVVVVVLGSFSFPLPPKRPPKKPFFLVVVGAGVVVLVVVLVVGAC